MTATVAGTAESKDEGSRGEQAKRAIKGRPKFLVYAVDLLAASASEGKVTLGVLGSYLKRMDPAFSPQTYGHSGLLNMVRTYDMLALHQEAGGHWSVMKAQVPDHSKAAPSNMEP